MQGDSGPGPTPDRRVLRDFGLIFGGMMALLFGLLFPLLFGHELHRWPWVLLIGMIAWSLSAPMTLRPIYRLWMAFGRVMSRITTPLIMGIVYFLVVTPTGLLRRLLGRDPMRRSLDENTDSYRNPSETPTPERMKRPF